MKILMIAVFTINSTNCSQSIGFKNNGLEVIEYDYRNKKTMNNIQRDADIIQLCKKEKPDIVFFSKCNDVDINVINECNKISTTILWYMDPLNSQFTKSLREKILNCNYTFCALIDPYNEAKKLNSKNVFFIQEGFDENSNYPVDVPYRNDVSFIGSLRNDRRKYYDYFKFKVYNSSYNKDHSIAVSESRINLNFTEGGTSDRTYKILASRGFLLTQPWPEMENDFIVGKDLDVFTCIDELKDKIDFYLKNENLRLKIAENGYNTVQKFNRTNFAKKILKTIKKEN